MTKYLHIANPDKFTLPLCKLLTSNQEFNNHKFLFVSDQFDKEIHNSDSISFFSSPIRNELIKNLFLFYKQCNEADIIIMHNGSGSILFNIFPWFTKKNAWVINGAELYGLTKNDNNSRAFKFVLKKTKVHLTHIEGDSILANEKLRSKAKFHYSPVYLSNVVTTSDFNPTLIKDKVKIMVGNSTSQNNDHITILQNLKKFEKNIEYIICPLSYGIYLDYKESVKVEGYKLFGDLFKPVEEFMSMDKYIDLLKDVDVAVFNHWRQEAMGVTLSLLSLGKIVYVNPGTTSYSSLINRGFKIYDNNLLFEEGPSIQRNVQENKSLLEKYYSLNKLIESLNDLHLNHL